VRIKDIGNESDNRESGGFRAVERRLRDEKPTLTALELDAIKRQAMGSAARKSTRPTASKKGTFMKSRFALVLVLAFGVILSGSGAALAVSGSSGSGSASSAQYPETCHEEEAGGKRGKGSCEPPKTCHEEESAGERASGSCGSEPAKNCHEEEEAKERASGSCVQAHRQEASGGGSLPFTGFLAVPALLVGLGLLGAGVAMRVRMRSSEGPGLH
jgi:hypothetical protein